MCECDVLCASLHLHVYVCVWVQRTKEGSVSFGFALLRLLCAPLGGRGSLRLGAPTAFSDVLRHPDARRIIQN